MEKEIFTISKEELEKQLEETGLSFARAIGKAKRKFSDSHKVITYDDKISKEEEALFKDDPHLAGLVTKQALLDKQITDYMNHKLAVHRSKPKSEIGSKIDQIREEAKNKTIKPGDGSD